MKRKQFIPKIGEKFWFIDLNPFDDCCGVDYTYRHTNLIMSDFLCGVYKTKKEAQAALKELKMILNKWRGH